MGDPGHPGQSKRAFVPVFQLAGQYERLLLQIPRLRQHRNLEQSRRKLCGTQLLLGQPDCRVCGVTVRKHADDQMLEPCFGKGLCAGVERGGPGKAHQEQADAVAPASKPGLRRSAPISPAP